MFAFILLFPILAGHLALAGDAAQPSATEIMKQVAANQDRAQQERSSYVYQQQVHVFVRRTNGKLAREEQTELSIAPEAKGSERKIVSIKGRYWKKDRYVAFSGEPVPDRDTLDGSLAESFASDLTNDDSKDGLGKDLFPLTTDQQKDLRFELKGQEIIAGRAAYRIRFGPAEKGDITWTGEAVIDVHDLGPVSVYTQLSRKLPLFVRTLLGTDVPGLGFNVQYKQIAEGVWFPISFGTEFRLRAVFFINRTISVSLENRNFQHTAASSTVRYGEQEGTPPPPQ